MNKPNDAYVQMLQDHRQEQRAYVQMLQEHRQEQRAYAQMLHEHLQEQRAHMADAFANYERKRGLQAKDADLQSQLDAERQRANRLADELTSCERSRDGYKHSHREAIDAYNDLRSFIGSKLRAEFDRLRAKR